MAPRCCKHGRLHLHSQVGHQLQVARHRPVAEQHDLRHRQTVGKAELGYGLLLLLGLLHCVHQQLACPVPVPYLHLLA